MRYVYVFRGRERWDGPDKSYPSLQIPWHRGPL